jgi:serine/threonine protein kinase
MFENLTHLLPLDQVAQEKQMNSVLREIDIMKGVDSPQIVKYYGMCYY